MRIILVPALLAVMGLTAFATADDKKADIDAKKLIGRWEPTGKDLPEGLKAVIEFGKDGKMSIEVEVQGKKESRAGTYKLGGDKLTVTFGEDKPKVSTVQKLTDDMLEFKTAEGRQTVLKRIKEK